MIWRAPCAAGLAAGGAPILNNPGWAVCGI